MVELISLFYVFKTEGSFFSPITADPFHLNLDWMASKTAKAKDLDKKLRNCQLSIPPKEATPGNKSRYRESRKKETMQHLLYECPHRLRLFACKQGARRCLQGSLT